MPRDWEGGASQFSHLQGEIGHVFLIPDTTNGTAIYAAPLTPLAPPQLIGIYMAVPWSIGIGFLPCTIGLEPKHGASPSPSTLLALRPPNRRARVRAYGGAGVHGDDAWGAFHVALHGDHHTQVQGASDSIDPRLSLPTQNGFHWRPILKNHGFIWLPLGFSSTLH